MAVVLVIDSWAVLMSAREERPQTLAFSNPQELAELLGKAFPKTTELDLFLHGHSLSAQVHAVPSNHPATMRAALLEENRDWHDDELRWALEPMAPSAQSEPQVRVWREQQPVLAHLEECLLALDGPQLRTVRPLVPFLLPATPRRRARFSVVELPKGFFLVGESKSGELSTAVHAGDGSVSFSAALVEFGRRLGLSYEAGSMSRGGMIYTTNAASADGAGVRQRMDSSLPSVPLVSLFQKPHALSHARHLCLICRSSPVARWIKPLAVANMLGLILVGALLIWGNQQRGEWEGKVNRLQGAREQVRLQLQRTAALKQERQNLEKLCEGMAAPKAAAPAELFQKVSLLVPREASLDRLTWSDREGLSLEGRGWPEPSASSGRAPAWYLTMRDGLTREFALPGVESEAVWHEGGTGFVWRAKKVSNR